MTLPVAARIARRELRGGLAGFRIFLLCLTLGVAAIAAVGSVRAAIEAGLRDEGAVLLGGDAEMEFTYRYASPEERAWMDSQALAVSEIVDFRSLATVGEGQGADRALTQVKGVDGAYPLAGAVRLDPPMPLARAFAGHAPQAATGADAETGAQTGTEADVDTEAAADRGSAADPAAAGAEMPRPTGPDASEAARGQSGDGMPGAVMQPVLADRLGIAPGDTFRLGTKTFRLAALLEVEPDAAAAGFSLGPRTLLRTADLQGSGLLQPGTLFETQYRLDLPDGADLAALRAEALGRFEGDGLRWRDARNGAPGVRAFVERIGAFLVLVGLAGLAVGGVGISASVRAYLAGKTATIATLKTLGADRATIFATYLIQVGLLTGLGIALGLVLGAALPLLASPLLQANLPVPIALGLHPGPLAEAAIYGALTALIFTLWPLARTENVRAAALFRDASGGLSGLPRRVYLWAIGGLAALLVGLAAWLSEVPDLALWAAAGVAVALAVLAATAAGLRRLARAAARLPLVRGRPALRLALGAIGGPGEEAGSVILSLGLGLAVLSAIGQIDTNLRTAIEGDLPEIAPSYFFVDIQSGQLAGFRERLDGDPAVSRVETAPMLRGIITGINGRPAQQVAGEHWVLNGDRGVTYSERPTPQTQITAGEWWPEGYDGPPQVSFAAEEAAEIGLRLGDSITVNILGRDIEAEVTSFRVVDFSTAGIGFILSMNPAALEGAPHTHIATVYAEEEAEAAILRDLAGRFPNITAVRVRDAIDNVARVLESLASATSYAAAATLVTGFVVLIGAAAAGERSRVYEAAVLKTLGASRRRILSSFALRSALLGAASGLVALAAGAAAGWGVIVYVMEASYSLAWGSAVTIIAGGIAATLAAGLAFAWRPLAARPARVLRSQD